jgi:hypothetical protein
MWMLRKKDAGKRVFSICLCLSRIGAWSRGDGGRIAHNRGCRLGVAVYHFEFLSW